MSGPGDGEWRWTLVLWLLVALAFLPGILSLKRCCLLPYPPLASLITLFYPLWVVPSMGSLCSICAGLRVLQPPRRKAKFLSHFFPRKLELELKPDPSRLEHDFIPDYLNLAPCETFHFCDMPAYENATSDSDIPVQGSAEALSGVWCKSVREEIAFEQPPRPIVCKTVRHTTKKAVPKLPLPFHPEKEILKPSKKGRRSACYKSQKTASEMKLNTTHDAAKSSEENSCQYLQDRVPRSLRVPLSSVEWPQLFKLQTQDGFWQFTSELGMLLDLDVHHLIVTFAKNGIQSLGLKGKEKLLQLIATLLVLQAVYFKQLEGLIFKSIMELKDSPPSWALDPVRKATEWAKRANREFPGICQRLQLGKDWDDATKKLLGI